MFIVAERLGMTLGEVRRMPGWELMLWAEFLRRESDG